MCTEEVCHLLSQYVDALLLLVDQRDGSMLDMLEHIYDEMLYLMGVEDEACMGTDRTLNQLRTLMETTWQTTKKLYSHEAWEGLQELSVQLLIALNELTAQLQSVTVSPSCER